MDFKQLTTWELKRHMAGARAELRRRGMCGAPQGGYIVAGWLRGHEFIGLPEHVRPGDVPLYQHFGSDDT